MRSRLNAIDLGLGFESRVASETGLTTGETNESALAALVEGARSGDRSAFGRLYERFAPMVHGILLARVRPADADDLTQEVFLSAMQRLKDLRDTRAFGG